MFTEDDLLPISALQHLAFCERQWGLIHLEQVWEENVLTAQGRQLHDKAHDAATEVRGDVRIARGLRLRSLRLGLVGMADVVEFHRIPEAEEEMARAEERRPSTGSGWRTAVPLPGVDGLWRPLIVEYKRGKPKVDRCDEVQVCAQALCLEEMLCPEPAEGLGVSIPSAAFFYGQPRRRYDVSVDETLRAETEALAVRLHDLTRAGVTPPPEYGPKCESCSLINVCLPKATGHRGSVQRYLARAIGDLTPNPFPLREGAKDIPSHLGKG